MGLAFSVLEKQWTVILSIFDRCPCRDFALCPRAGPLLHSLSASVRQRLEMDINLKKYWRVTRDALASHTDASCFSRVLSHSFQNAPRFSQTAPRFSRNVDCNKVGFFLYYCKVLLSVLYTRSRPYAFLGLFSVYAKRVFVPNETRLVSRVRLKKGHTLYIQTPRINLLFFSSSYFDFASRA